MRDLQLPELTLEGWGLLAEARHESSGGQNSDRSQLLLIDLTEVLKGCTWSGLWLALVQKGFLGEDQTCVEDAERYR